MHPDLSRCRDRLRRALADLTPEAADRPRDGKWSIAGILEHLDLAYTLNAAAIDRRLRDDAARARPARPKTARERLARFVVVTLGWFPHGREAPEAVLPRGLPFAEVAAGLDGHLAALDERLRDAERVFGATRPILNHPVMGPLSVADWRRFHWVHTRHHLKQI